MPTFRTAPSLTSFTEVVADALQTHAANERQANAIRAEPGRPLLIVAGPGTGKTTTLVLRALRFVFVEQVAPEDILITTFTEKAGKEIRSRLIEWGSAIRSYLLARARDEGDGAHEAQLASIDVNRFVAGTLDSIAQEAVRDTREPNEAPPTVLEQSAARSILYRRGELARELREVDDLKAYLGQYGFSGDPVRNNGEATEIMRTLVDRLVQDRVDLAAFAGLPGDTECKAAVLRVKERYEAFLAQTNQMDFALLERRFLENLEAGDLPRSLAGLRVVMVDEYQDTNPLQEAIYFELVRRTGASFTVVGDDDQSLYRFRGATIELFRDFRERVAADLSCPEPSLECLNVNYRSSPQIVAFFGNHIDNDPDFAGARVRLPAEIDRSVVAHAGPAAVGVLGMFRQDAQTLAEDLADFLHRLFRQGGRVPEPHEDSLDEPILPADDGGDLGDAVLLASTTAERGRPSFGKPGKDRFPLLLRRELAARDLAVFNPRGQALRDLPNVQAFMGIALCCLDPEGVAQEAVYPTRDANDFLDAWRATGAAIIARNPTDSRGQQIVERVERWQRLCVEGRDSESEWPLLDIFYSFLPWFTPFQDDPEAQVQLEAITRAVAAASTYSGYKAAIQRDDPHRTRSVQSALRDVFLPIAEDLIQVDEDIMPSIPRDRLSIMTIHQAKGLEFPLVIVDVSSDFKGAYHMQKFKRFPEEESAVVRMENDLAAATPVGAARLQRSGMQRTFEDLVRLYYVAYSRPQSLLLLVGCQQGLQYKTKIKNVAKFWRRDESWAWISDPQLRRPPAEADLLPFVRL